MKLALEMSKDSLQRLEALRKDLGAVNMNEVVRESLSYLRWCRDAVARGEPFYIAQRGDIGTLRKIRFWVLEFNSRPVKDKEK